MAPPASEGEETAGWDAVVEVFFVSESSAGIMTATDTERSSSSPSRVRSRRRRVDTNAPGRPQQQGPLASPPPASPPSACSEGGLPPPPLDPEEAASLAALPLLPYPAAPPPLAAAALGSLALSPSHQRPPRQAATPVGWRWGSPTAEEGTADDEMKVPPDPRILPDLHVACPEIFPQPPAGQVPQGGCRGRTSFGGRAMTAGTPKAPGSVYGCCCHPLWLQESPG